MITEPQFFIDYRYVGIAGASEPLITFGELVEKIEKYLNENRQSKNTQTP